MWVLAAHPTHTQEGILGSPCPVHAGGGLLTVGGRAWECLCVDTQPCFLGGLDEFPSQIAGPT